MGRDNIFYEPQILTEVKSDGSKISKVVVNVFPDRTDRDENGQLDFQLFTDKVYFEVKELFDEFESQNLSPSDVNTENDGEIFGWALTNQWHHIGNVYYFLLSAYNIIETKQDESPIIDAKGYI